MSKPRLTKTSREIWNYLIEALKNPHAVAGIMGNLWDISEFKTGERKDGTIGIGNWSSSIDKRGLENYAKRGSTKPTDLSIQLFYLVEELTISPRYALLLRNLKKVRSLSAATQFFMSSYPTTKNNGDDGVKALMTRTEYAKIFFNTYNTPKKNKKIEANLEDNGQGGMKYVGVRLKGKKLSVEITADRCVVRSADSSSGKKVGMAYKGGKYEYVLSNADMSWHCIKYGDTLRWVSARYSHVVED